MPQLSKGGKYVFGWSMIREDGGVVIPEEARREYRLESGETLILASGSKTSGGFSIAKKSVLERSKLSAILSANPELSELRIEEGQTVKFKSRRYCWTRMRGNGVIILPAHTLEVFCLRPGDDLLSIRSSDIAIGLAVKGPIIEEAKKHPEIAVFE